MTVGVDVGGSRIKLVRLDEGSVVERRQVEITEDWLEGLAESIKGFAPDPGPVGVAVAGLVDHRAGKLTWAPHLPGTDVPVQHRLEAELGVAVVVDNDANCAARAEAFGLAADPMVVVMIGTGIGMGLWLAGDVYRGHGFAGEAGHMTVEPDGRRCRCGRRGCWETRVSGWRLAELDPERADVLAEAGRWLGRGLFNLVTLLDPARVVVGGGVIAEHGEELLACARRELERLADPHRPAPVLQRGRHGIWAGAVGAALLADPVSSPR